MKNVVRWCALFISGVCVLGPALAAGDVTAGDIANAVTEMDLERARALSKSAQGAGAAFDFQRARLAIYVGDCDSAEAILGPLAEQPEAASLATLARTCARATAASKIIEDTQAGVWIRLQDAGDEALVPELVRVAAAARQTMIDDLGVELPRPLRIDLVRDLFSLSAVSGLPLEAAETTGTVAVARWGRVTMLSPRAAMFGYPWQDTLAHEVTHLALSRGSRDFAPLWLQEGIAKREETRWRRTRPFDGQRDADRIARDALLEGKSVGVNQIGPSIAMLPSPEAAGISYAEVESFMDFWIARNGKPAFLLLLTDLKGLESRDAEEVMTGVTGYPLTYWIAAWQEHLRQLPKSTSSGPAVDGNYRQTFRLGDLLADRGHGASAEQYFRRAHEVAPAQAAVRQRLASAQLAQGKPHEEVMRSMGSLLDMSGLHGGWLGLHGHLLALVQRLDEAEASLELGSAVDPYSVEVACAGRGLGPGGDDVVVTLPGDAQRQPLCAEARKLLGD